MTHPETMDFAKAQEIICMAFLREDDLGLIRRTGSKIYLKL
jgi:hypothetical protein